MVTLQMTEDQAKALTFLLGRTAGTGAEDLGYDKMFNRMWNQYGYVHVENARDSSAFMLDRKNVNEPVTVHADPYKDIEIDFR
jgi:hypothetical protein